MWEMVSLIHSKLKRNKEYKYEMKLGYNKYLDLVQLYKNPSQKNV